MILSDRRGDPLEAGYLRGWECWKGEHTTIYCMEMVFYLVDGAWHAVVGSIVDG